jgi:hypothetical protein
MSDTPPDPSMARVLALEARMTTLATLIDGLDTANAAALRPVLAEMLAVVKEAVLFSQENDMSIMATLALNGQAMKAMSDNIGRIAEYIQRDGDDGPEIDLGPFSLS